MPHRSATTLLLLTAGGLMTQPAAAVDFEERKRPVPLKKQPGCELWVGEAVGGNDPTIEIEIRICPDGDGKVIGRTQWSSLRSGWNLRETKGRWEDNTLIMEDVRFVELKPNPDWYFCLIDRYTFAREGRTLTGGYISTPCNDHAELSLTLRGKTTRWPEAPSPEPAPVVPDAPQEDEEERPATPIQRACGGCAITSATPLRRWPVWWLLGLVGVGVARLNRRPSRPWRAPRR